MKLDLAQIPAHPTNDVLSQLAGLVSVPKLATNPEDIEKVPGFMGGQCFTNLPHVFHQGSIYFPNVFLARLYFLEKNADLEACMMDWSARIIMQTFAGFMFFRFDRVAS